jgi:hypothetical protein
MVMQENKKHLLEFRKEIEKCLLEKLSDNEEALKVAQDMLNSASLVLQKAETKQELIGIYLMISVRLNYFGYIYLAYQQIDLGSTLNKISLSLYECIEEYLPNNIKENDLIKSLWTYDSKDVDSVKNALSEYIFDNVFIFGPGYIFAHDFISNYEDEIKEAKTPREVMRVYSRIYLQALIHLYECCGKKKYREALKYDMLSEIIRFMISDFRDLVHSEN